MKLESDGDSWVSEIYKSPIKLSIEENVICDNLLDDAIYNISPFLLSI